MLQVTNHENHKRNIQPHIMKYKRKELHTSHCTEKTRKNTKMTEDHSTIEHEGKKNLNSLFHQQKYHIASYFFTVLFVAKKFLIVF